MKVVTNKGQTQRGDILDSMYPTVTTKGGDDRWWQDGGHKKT